jgi:lipopolysaccharide transport system permease protein
LGYKYRTKYPAVLVIKHWQLLSRVTLNELISKYAGSILGIGWAAFTPLILLVIYSVVYVFIFRVRVPGMSVIDYVLFIFCGLIPFMSISESISSGVSSLISNKSALNSTVFPIELAPAKAVLLSQVSMVIGIPVILLASVFVGLLSWPVLLLPIIWFMQILFLMGLNWILSILNVVFRDLQNIVYLFITVLFIASPIAYTTDMVPPGLIAIVGLNPISYFVMAYQDVIALGKMPGITTICMLLAISIGTFVLGNWFFMRTKGRFIDHV